MSKLERSNVIHTIKNMEQFKDEYKKLGENFDYFVTDTLTKALKNSKFHHRNIFYVAKERVFVTVTEKTMTEKITELLKKYNGLGILRQNGD